jgi:hypothetical protein
MRKLTIKGAKTKAWTAISRYVRSIEKQCCTCGKPTSAAGHWKHNGDKPNNNLGGNELWYDIRNIHGQCFYCNNFQSGNLSEYSIFLENKYGAGILQELQHLYNTPRKWTIEEILAVAELYERKCGIVST